MNKDLNRESEKKVFWLNVYNAYVQLLLTENPGLLENRDRVVGYNFFSSDQIYIAQKKISLDKIEHGIIRRSKNKLSYGFLGKLFPGKYERKFRWAETDPRVHFALNCGAASCPYIAIYEKDRVEEQLEITTKNYLQETTQFNSEENKVTVNRLMNWFRADFGGKKGVVPYLKRYDIIPQDAKPSVSFLPYDWTVDLGNYQDI